MMDGTEQLVDTDVDVPAGASDAKLSEEGRDALAAQIGPILDKVQDTEFNEPDPDAPIDPDPEVASDEDVVPDPDAENKEDAGSDNQPESEDEPKTEEADAPESTLPAAYRRSLKAVGWQEDEIDKFWAGDPELAMKTFERVHMGRNKETADWARLGRQIRQGAEPAPVAAAPADQSAGGSAGGLMPIDVEALVEQYGGNEDMIKAIVGPVNSAINTLNAALPEVQAGVAAIRQSKQDTLGQQIEDFYGSTELVPYAKVYGNLKDGLTEDQQTNRHKMLGLADDMRAGASVSGRDLSPGEAMEMAHAAVASDYKAEAIRTEIKKSTKKRAAGVTLKPNKSNKTAADSSVGGRRGLEQKVKSALLAAFPSEDF